MPTLFDPLQIGDITLPNRIIMLRVVLCSLMNVIPVVATIFGAAYAVQPSYGIGFSKSLYLWIPVIGNIVAVLVIPYVGDLSDRIGRRMPIIVGSIGAGLLSFAYLYAISIHNVPLAMVMSILMWGVIYQGYNAIFPSFYPELFPTRSRVSAMAIGQNIGTTITALLPALFAYVAPPGSHNVPLTIGAITFAITIVCAIAACLPLPIICCIPKATRCLATWTRTPRPRCWHAALRVARQSAAPCTAPC